VLTLTFLGVGSAFAKRNFQSNALIEAWSRGPGKQSAPDDTLLIDFGATGPMALHALKSTTGFGYLDAAGAINYPAIRRVFVTHLHGDHVGGLEEMAGMNAYFFAGDGRTRHRPELISAPILLGNLWERCLRGGLEAGHGRGAALGDYFRERPVLATDRSAASTFTLLERYHLSPFRTDHIRLAEKYDWPSCGLWLRDERTCRAVFYSGDTRFDPQAYGAMWEEASIIFHEAQLVEEEEPVHTLLTQLRTLPGAIRRKMILYHFGDEWDDPSFSFVSSEFAGFSRAHTRYVLFD
jgi:ribonuclease BN (tRNA processing enzyme)